MSKQFNVGIYARLSVDDVNNNARKAALDTFDESTSIKNQKDFLSAHVRKMGWHEVKTYVDDGFSGSDFERPAFEEMMGDVYNGTINLILVKDLSRFGRNYIKLGELTDFILPTLGCRLVALEDAIDTGSENNEMMHFRSLLNDQYLKDLSKKIKASHKIMAMEGKKVGGRPPYGFMDDPADKHKFLVDAYAAGIVQKMYEMRAQNTSYAGIAKFLNNEGVLSPREHEYHRLEKEFPYKMRAVWLIKSVKRILSSEVYLGHRVQLKQGTMSYRLQKMIQKPPEEWIRCENALPAIIDRELWETVQNINNKAKESYRNAPVKKSLFQGILRCTGCGGKFVYNGGDRKLSNGTVKSYQRYQCARYQQSGGSCCSSHSVRENDLKQIVTDELHTLANRLSINRDKVAANLRKSLGNKHQDNSISSKKTLKQIKSELAGLEQKIAKLYEDKVADIISEETFSMLLQGFQSEQNALDTERLRLTEIQTEVEHTENDITSWMALIEKHCTKPEVDRELLDALIDRIEIGEQKMVDGQRAQSIRVFYRFIGSLE